MGMTIRATESDSRVPHLKEIIDKWAEEMIDRCEGRFMRTRYDSGKEHIFRFVTKVGGEIETDKVNKSNQHLFPSLFVRQGIEEIDRK